MNSSIGVHEIDDTNKGVKPPASPFFPAKGVSQLIAHSDELNQKLRNLQIVRLFFTSLLKV